MRAKSSKVHRFRSQQFAVILAATLPILLVTGLLLVWQENERQKAIERGLSNTAHALATAVERQLDTWRAALNALATSPALDSENLSAFYAQARAVAQQHDANIVLFDERLRQRINTLRPYGEPLPLQPRRPEATRLTFSSSTGRVGGPFVGKVAQDWTISVEVPVERNGSVIYALNMFFRPEILSDLLAGQNLPAAWTAVILNEDSVFVARSESITNYIGRNASADFVRAVSGRDDGIAETRLLTGPLRIVAFKRLNRTPWTIAVAPTSAALTAEGRAPLLIFSGLTLLAIGVAAMLAWLFGRRVIRPLESLASSADNVLRGESTDLRPLKIFEFETLRRALKQSGERAREAIKAREKAAALEANAERLRNSEERQRLLAREVDHRAKNLLAVVQSLVNLTRANDVRAFAAAIEGRIMALGNAHSLLASNRWEGADLRKIIEDELAPYRTGGQHIDIAGPGVTVARTAAQSIALALHELTTNALKYGALSTPGGRLSIDWRVSDEGLVLSWKESGGPPISGAPTDKGFGSVLIRKTIVDELDGSLAFDWSGEGLHATLSLPRTHLATVQALDEETSEQSAKPHAYSRSIA